jgi:hypothetical protein
MFRSVLIGCVALAAGSSLAIGAPQDDLKAAAQKLSDAASYSWKSTVEAAGGNNRGGGPSEGKTEKDGYTMVTMTRGENKVEILRKGDKVAIKTADGGWKTPAELAADNAGGGGANPGRFAGRAGQNMPAKTAEDLAADVKDLTASGDGFAGPLSEDGAKKALTGGGRRGGANANAAAPEISGAKGDVKFMVKDGILTGYELHVTGKVTRNGNDVDIDRTTKVEISDVGSTKVEVPDEAKKKIEE